MNLTRVVPVGWWRQNPEKSKLKREGEELETETEFTLLISL